MMSLPHVRRIFQVLELLADFEPARAFVVVADTCVALQGGLALGLTMEEIIKVNREIITEEEARQRAHVQ